MNYINKLQQDVKALEAEVAGYKAGIAALRRYLQSSKFHQDPTVQVQDVLNRLDDINLNYIPAEEAKLFLEAN